MGHRFDIARSYVLSSTGRSLKLKLDDRLDEVFISLSEIEKVAKGMKKSGTIYVLNEDSAGNGDLYG